MTVNQKILEYLAENGIKQNHLAKKLGVSKQNLSRILNSDDLKVSMLIKICNVLNIKPTHFLN